MLQELGIDHVAAFGITCKVLCDEDLPLIVTWRNIDEIRFFMEDDRLISKATINFWFASIKNKNTQIPYIVKFNDISCGYMEIKNIDCRQKTGEFGIFLFGKEYFGAGIAERIALCWEIILKKTGIETGFSRIHAENTRSIKFFTKIGGEFSHRDGKFFIFKHTLAKRRASLKHIAKRLHLEEEFIKAIEV